MAGGIPPSWFITTPALTRISEFSSEDTLPPEDESPDRMVRGFLFLGLRQRFDDGRGLDADRLADRQELDHVQLAFAALVLRHERLRAIEAGGDLSLSQL